MTTTAYPNVPPPPLPSLQGYVKPALVSAGVAGAGYGVGYIAGVLASSALAGHPGAARKLFGATPAVRARNFDRMADLAGKASEDVIRAKLAGLLAVAKSQLMNEF